MSITLRLGGQRLEEALTNGYELLLRMSNGGDARIIWVNDNGEIIKGKPVILSTGVYLKAPHVQSLINLPNAAIVGR